MPWWWCILLWKKSSRGKTIWGNRTESLREGNLPLRGSLRGPLKTSETPLNASGNLQKPSENPLSQRPSQRQISLSEALGPVAPIHLPLANFLQLFSQAEIVHLTLPGFRFRTLRTRTLPSLAAPTLPSPALAWPSPGLARPSPGLARPLPGHRFIKTRLPPLAPPKP